MHVLKMLELPLKGKRVLIREDLNVPVKNGVVTGEARLHAALPTIQKAREAGARGCFCRISEDRLKASSARKTRWPPWLPG